MKSLSLSLPTVLVVSAFALGTPALAAEEAGKPPQGYEKVSTLVELPEFVPGLGVLYVKPETLPVGPFLGYDKSGRLVNTTYMVPLEALTNKDEFPGLNVASQPVDHVAIQYNGGHPGVEDEHYHIVLWHVPADQAAQLQE